ncbi:stress response protein NST1-like [Cryptomeria japonica]|uniref:stress response protein NST1-like n=1 Tax=Cryptomeria japonica TaxID=3369 RepID=UPI0027DA5593|nr:stress response protein NST1-like [Cryptomeria japonica]
MAAQPHAWMTKELFLNWLHHFARSIPGGVSPNNRHLLIFDGHGSHVAFPMIQEAKVLGIDLVTFPAHTSHKLQPLGVSVFSPFNNYFKSERLEWMAKHHRLEINRSELARLFSLAFKKALTADNIKAGFKRTVIWPLNPTSLMNDMNPSREFNVDVEEEDETIAIESILSFAGGQHDTATAENGQHDTSTSEQGQHDTATAEQVQHDTSTAEHDSASKYGVEDEDNLSRENEIMVDEEENRMQSLSSFLRLPNAMVNEKYSHKSGGTIRLSRQSQILIGDEYMQIYMEQEAKKKEIADLKARKKERADERKAARAIERELKEQKKVENALKKQKKEHLRIIQRKEKDQKKEEVKRMKEFEKARKELERQRRLSNPLYPILENSILRDMINIYTPAYSSVANYPINNQVSMSQLQILITPSKEQEKGGSSSNIAAMANDGHCSMLPPRMV